MGQVIPFPVAALAYPSRTEELDGAEGLLLLAIRSWVAAIRQAEDPERRLEQWLARVGLEAAVAPVLELMGALAHAARRQIQVHCPHCANLSADEAQLLQAASLAQASEAEEAMRALSLVLLSTQDLEFALVPLEEIGALFASAGRMLRRRRPRESAMTMLV